MSLSGKYIQRSIIAVLSLILIATLWHLQNIVKLEVMPKSRTMILLQRAYNNFDIKRNGIIHIGARYAEELPLYKNFKIKDILWIEADPTAKNRLVAAIANDPTSIVAIFAATDTNGTTKFYRTSNNGHSSSIFKLKKHKIMSPDVVEDRTMNVVQKRLDDYLKEKEKLNSKKYNVIVLDIQGGELLALKGAINTLRNIDAIIAEVNYDELYEGAAHIFDLDSFLKQQGFVRVDTITVNRKHSYGDALYVKRQFCEY